MSEVKNFKSSHHSIDYIHVDNGSPITMFMLHGYGANMRDLAPLASLSPELKKLNWIFPDGIIKVPIGPYMHGKAWFPIDMMKLNQAITNGGFEEIFADHIPEGLEESSQSIKEMIEELSHDKFLLGGFSQGSMMANYLTFEKGLDPESLILLSSTLIAKDIWKKRLEESSWKKPIFQSHGTGDPVLPVDLARALTQLIRSSKREVYSIEFNGGHEIPPIVMKQLIEFFKKNQIL